MHASEIVVTKDQRLQALASQPAYRPQDLVHWTGLRLAQFRLPERVHDRHIHGAHPIITLLRSGRTESHLRYGQREVNTQCRAGELMCYRGGLEIEQARWQASDATLLSVELDPQRLLHCEQGDERLAPPVLVGAPRFSDARLAATLQALWDEVIAGCPRGRLYVDSLSLGLASQVHTRFGALQPDRREAAARLTPAQRAHVQAFIEAHLGEPIGLVELAQAAGLSRYHFARLFRNTLGHSPYQHVLQQRVARARRLLRNRALSLSEVALRTGFASQAHFSDTCRRLLGSTPGELRARG
ncbi:MAG: helix-turn-helix transcriptional regulator [Burkholderiales bacterium]|nr:helix-turn-helix transcriptional regulator [Burkholderiales bacterium]